MNNMSSSAEIIAWACFVLGAVVLLAGCALGLLVSWRETSQGLSAKDAQSKVKAATTQVEELTKTAVAAANDEKKNEAAATKASTTGGAAESALKEIEGIIGGLPERLRFSGVLILIGALLMSVATVQFGGHSIF